MAGAPPERWNGAAAATQIDAVAIPATRTNFFRRNPRMVRLSILRRRSQRVSYRRAVREPNPIRSVTLRERMLLVLLTPFESPLRSWIAMA